ncbi:MAG: ABC transporter permease [Planctomycetes bacterium]|nr:ABC transporter permease [Planctomycetota bacterium]
MYKLLIAWRYLRTRYIALASIVSVTLGVATLIIVNSVMSGFSIEMQKRLNGILSDIVIEGPDLIGGFPNAERYMDEVRKVVGGDLAGMTATVHIPAMLNFEVQGQYFTRQINLIGVDEATYATVSDFGKYLLHPENRLRLAFDLRENGYAPDRPGFPLSGWQYRRMRAALHASMESRAADSGASRSVRPSEASGAAASAPSVPVDPTASQFSKEERRFDPAKEQHHGLILGIAVASRRHRDADGTVRDFHYLRPGDDVQVTFPSAANPPKAETADFTVVDFYESKMSEYDYSFAFVPLWAMQDLRGMVDPATGSAAVTAIQIKVQPGADLDAVRDRLRSRFPPNAFPYFRVDTWRDLQGPLLAAVQLETTILNILLFLIIAVAGFGILATFFMIVVEKTRDIGILKSLGAPSMGVMSIFLGYGLSLGMVGSGAGAVLGLVFVAYINEVADLLETVTGREVFDPTVYYFQEIPAVVEPWTVILVAAGATMIAVVASVLPAIRAARLHPVEALRYE